MLREYIARQLESGGPTGEKEAQRTVHDLAEFSDTAEADRLFETHKVDVAAPLAALALHRGWDPRFAKYQLKRAHERIQANRKRREKERSCKSGRKGSATHPA